MIAVTRKIAVKCLIRIEKGGYSNLVLKQELSSEISDRDRAFCCTVVYGTLSRQITIDHFLDRFLKHGTAKLDEEVRAILRSAFYQIFWMDSVPARAAVNEAVELCRCFKKSSAASLVNAVLRKCSALNMESELDSLGADEQSISIKYSIHPRLAGLLKNQYCGSAEQVFNSLFDIPRTFCRVNTLKTDENALLEELSSNGMSVKKSSLESCFEADCGVGRLKKYLDGGFIRIQSFPAQFVCSCVDPGSGENILDMCAAPGGKTLTIAQEMKNKGHITALDIYENRLELIRSQAQKENVSILSCYACDASEFRSDTLFDRILCDVPCSGYGEIASKPELRNKDPEESKQLPDIQYGILSNAASLLKNGGILVYSTCTVLERENEKVIDRFLGEHPDFEGIVISERPSWTGGRDFEVRFDPCPDCCEGFYVACLKKV